MLRLISSYDLELRFPRVLQKLGTRRTLDDLSEFVAREIREAHRLFIELLMEKFPTAFVESLPVENLATVRVIAFVAFELLVHDRDRITIVSKDPDISH